MLEHAHDVLQSPYQNAPTWMCSLPLIPTHLPHGPSRYLEATELRGVNPVMWHGSDGRFISDINK